MTHKKRQQESARRPLILFLSLGLLSSVFTLYTLMLTHASGQIAPLWLITALMTAAFFRSPLRFWLAVALACLSGSFIVSLSWYGIKGVQPLFSLINLFQALTGALLLRRFLSVKNPLACLSDWVKMLACGVIIPPLLSSALLILLFTPPGLPVAKAFTGWFTSEAVGALALLPLGLLFTPSRFFSVRRLPWLAETLGILAVTLLLSWLALSALPWPYAFIVVFLMWGALRLPRQYAFMLFFTSLLALYAITTSGSVSLITSNADALAYAPLLPLLVLLLPVNVITLVMHAFREERRRLSASESLFRNAMEYSAIGMALVSTEGKWLQVNQSLCRFLGYSAEELQALTFQQITWPGDLKSDLQKLDQLSLGEINSYSIEKRYFTSSGDLVWALLTVSVVRSPKSEPLYYIAQIEDINELKQSVQVNRRLMDRITLATEAGGVGIWEWDIVNNVLSWDKRMFELYDVSPETVPSYKLWLQSVVSEDRPQVEHFIQQALKNNDPFRLEFRIEVQGEIRHIRAFANRVLARNGETERLLGINMDMTEVKALNEALYQEKERLHITLDSIGEAVICTDIDQRITFMNPIAEQFSGYSRLEAIGQPVSRILHITQGENGSSVIDMFQSQLSPSLIEQDTVLHARHGTRYAIHCSVTPLTTLEGRSMGSVMVIQDVSESRTILKQLSYSASHDSLTRLANRQSFEQRLRTLLQQTLELGQQHVLVFIDLDRFKQVNDSAGHAAGDALLQELSAMMLSLLRTGDILARIGGDEFALLLPNCPRDNGQRIAGTLIQRINDYRFFWEGEPYRIGASAGLTQIDSRNAVAEEVLSQADMACYASKHSGRGRVTLYDARAFHAPAATACLPTQELSDMVCKNPVRIMAQAIAPARVSVTASLWQLSLSFSCNNAQTVSESVLRDLLQDTNLLLQLDRRVAHLFFTQFAGAVSRSGYAVTLPLSAAGLSNPLFVSEVLNALEEYHMPARLLHLSVSCQALDQATPELTDNLQRLHKAGCRLLISQVRSTPDRLNLTAPCLFDYLLIDPQLVSDVHNSVMNEMTISMIQGHAQRAGLCTVAGPAETEQQLITLTRAGVDLLFGHAVSQASPLERVLSQSYFAIN